MRHIGDAPAPRLALGLDAEIAAKRMDAALLDDPHSGDKREQGRFADAVRPDHPDHPAGGDVEGQRVEGDHLAVAVRDPREAGGGAGLRHGSFTASESGHFALGEVRTKPRPRTPVFTCR